MSSPEKIYKRPKAGKITVVFKSHGAPASTKFCSTATVFVASISNVGEDLVNLTLHIRELLCVQWTTEKQRERGETFFYTFCTISFLFPPLRPLSAECAEFAFHGQEALEPARRENSEKRHKAGEKGGGEKMFLLSLALQYRKMDLLPRKPHWFFFPEVPGTQSYHYDQNTWTEQQLPNLTLKEGKKRKWSLLQSAPVFIFVLHHAQLVFMWASWWRSGNRAWKY